MIFEKKWNINNDVFIFVLVCVFFFKGIYMFVCIKLEFILVILFLVGKLFIED